MNFIFYTAADRLLVLVIVKNDKPSVSGSCTLLSDSSLRNIPVTPSWCTFLQLTKCLITSTLDTCYKQVFNITSKLNSFKRKLVFPSHQFIYIYFLIMQSLFLIMMQISYSSASFHPPTTKTPERT